MGAEKAKTTEGREKKAASDKTYRSKNESREENSEGLEEIQTEEIRRGGKATYRKK